MFILLEPRYIKLKVSAVGEAQQSQYTCGIGYSVLTPVRPATFSIYDIMHSGTRNPSHCTYLLSYYAMVEVSFQMKPSTALPEGECMVCAQYAY